MSDKDKTSVDFQALFNDAQKALKKKEEEDLEKAQANLKSKQDERESTTSKTQAERDAAKEIAALDAAIAKATSERDTKIKALQAERDAAKSKLEKAEKEATDARARVNPDLVRGLKEKRDAAGDKADFDKDNGQSDARKKERLAKEEKANDDHAQALFELKKAEAERDFARHLADNRAKQLKLAAPPA